MATRESLIRFKSNAWKHESVVAGYAQRMRETRGTNRLKNRIEVSLCAQHVRGTRIVDVGIGTGRGSLPLARAGMRVTGIDVSQAMLDECRREAAATPIDLRIGDLTALPIADEEFDSLISLNVAVHFPNWREALRDWARVVKPGGRLVFDVHSLDHLQAVAAHRGCEPEALLTPEQRDDAGWFTLRVGAEQIARAASECGLTVSALVPYAAVLGGGNVNYWLLDSRLAGYLGDRALSWIAVDERLFAFAAFLEEQIVARLSTHATGRYMVVLEKRVDEAQTAKVLDYQHSVAALFAGTPSLSALRCVVGSEVDQWPAQLLGHLQYPLNRALLGMMLSSPSARALQPLLREAVGGELCEELFESNRRQAVDNAVGQLIGSWHSRFADPTLLRYNGVDLGPSLEYDLTREMLDVEYFDGKAGTQ